MNTGRKRRKVSPGGRTRKKSKQSGLHISRVTGKNLQRYFSDIENYSPLESEHEYSLAVRIQNDDEAALAELVKANLRFVVSVARNYENQGLPLSDLINEGNIGLIKAARRFDPGKNFRFISYAVWWIRQAILSSLAQSSRIVKLPLNYVGRLYKVGKTRDRLEQQYRRIPDIGEMSIDLGITQGDVVTAINTSRNHKSLEAPVAKDSVAPLGEFIQSGEDSTDKATYRSALQREICAVMDSALDKKEQFVISKYFGINREEPITLNDIGSQLNLTRERVRQLKDRALDKLKKTSCTLPLGVYLAG